jgi:hypothetical protein
MSALAWMLIWAESPEVWVCRARVRGVAWVGVAWSRVAWVGSHRTSVFRTGCIFVVAHHLEIHLCWFGCSDKPDMVPAPTAVLEDLPMAALVVWVGWHRVVFCRVVPGLPPGG